MWDFAIATDRVRQLRTVVRRESARLVVLTLVAAGVFSATRVVAHRAEARELADAAAWYDRGHNLLTRDPAAAALAFRRAVTKHRQEKRYVLGLAEALARSGNTASAERALQGLRESSPEDGTVNLALARLNREQGEPAAALRYYYHAIYGPEATPERAREIRFELVRMLLDAGDATRAQSELLAATIDLPDLRDQRIEIAGLFERAGNDARASEQYRRVLETHPADLLALEGAVRTAFALDNYREALNYKLPPNAAAEVRELVTLSGEVLGRDPLAARLSAVERQRRVIRNIGYLEQRWRTCNAGVDQQLPPALIELRTAARPPSFGRDSDALEAALSTLDQLRRQIEQRCGNQSTVDRALAIIARRHGLDGA